MIEDLHTTLLWLFVGLVAIPLCQAIKTPRRIFEFPGFMAFAFAVFVIPQAIALIRFPGFVQEDSVTAILLMCCLSIFCCQVGYRLAPNPGLTNWLIGPLDLNRLLQVGTLFIGVALGMRSLIAVTPGEVSETGGLTGLSTILLFFQQLVYPGFAIALFCVLRRPTAVTIALALLGLCLPIEAVVTGRREETTVLAFTVAMALFYEKRVSPPRIAIVGFLAFAALAIPATAQYRSTANNGDWEAARNIDLVRTFQEFVAKDSILELRNGAAIIEATRETGDYEFGRGYWNHLVFRFIPAQLLGAEFKRSLMFDVWDVLRNQSTSTGIRFTAGTTITGMADTYSQFGWFGCLYFVFMAIIFKTMWFAASRPDATLARLMYVLTASSGMRAITHWTSDFLPGFIFMAIFLALAKVYAAQPAPRRLAVDTAHRHLDRRPRPA